MTSPTEAPGGFVVGQVEIAYLADAFRGGETTENRQAMVDQVMAAAPHVPYVARALHEFRQRMVRYLLAAGVRQFVDLASGLLSDGHVHDLLVGVSDARVVYVDAVEEIVAANRRRLPPHVPASVLKADIRDHERVLADPAVRDMLAAGPVGVLCVDTIQYFDDAEATGVVNNWARVIGPGSFVGLTHYAQDPMLVDGLAAFARMFGTPPHICFRSAAELETFLTAAGLSVVAPGGVRLPHWHPDTQETDDADRHTDRFPVFAALGRKP